MPDRTKGCTTVETGATGGELAVARGEEIVIAESVRIWAESLVPGDERAAGAGVSAALFAYTQGATPAEATEAGRRLLCSWGRHPSRPLPAPAGEAAGPAELYSPGTHPDSGPRSS